jgi:hypothetical protein
MLIVMGTIGAAVVFNNSSYVTKAGHFIEQPIAFSHETHVSDVGLKCQFCHSGVGENSNAEMPSMETCYGCHREVLANSNYLASVRNGYEKNKPILWERVNKVANHVYFHHGEHIKAGVSCVTCHGDVDHMPLMAPKQRFSMEYCLSCHKRQGPGTAPRLQDCYTCHR